MHIDHKSSNINEDIQESDLDIVKGLLNEFTLKESNEDQIPDDAEETGLNTEKQCDREASCVIRQFHQSNWRIA